MTEKVVEVDEKYKTPETSVWSSMTSALSRDLGEFVSEVKKELKFNTGEKKTSTSTKEVLVDEKWKTKCEDLEKENQMLKKKIETLQAEIDRLKSSSAVSVDSSSGSWVKPTLEEVVKEDEEDWHEWE